MWVKLFLEPEGTHLRGSLYRRATAMWTLSISLNVLAVPLQAATRNVPSQYATIQSAIDAAVAGDEVVIADGTYTGTGNKNLDFHGKAITVRSASGVAAACIIDCQNNGRGFYFHTNETNTSVVSGLTIQNGSVTFGSPGNAYGGGVFCTSSSPTLANCIIKGNIADAGGNPAYSYGGGMYCYSSNPLVTNCEISGNTVRGGSPGLARGGGGVFCGNFSSPTLIDCLIRGNSVGDNGSSSNNFGGGVHCSYYSSPTLDNCIISGNTASGSGGGLKCSGNSAPILTNCTIGDNSAQSGAGASLDSSGSPALTNCTIHGNIATISQGGGVLCGSSSSPTLMNCKINGNTSATDGGGISSVNLGSPILINCTISGNTATNGGGGAYFSFSNPTLTNCTINGNIGAKNGGGIACFSSNPTLTNCSISGNTTRQELGGGVACYSSSPTLTNCILWGDTPQEIYVSSGAPVVTYSNVQSGWTGNGNLNAVPSFGFADDLHLLPGSPCIDAGSNSPPGGLPTTDADGNPRLLDGNGDGQPVADMGAYEFNPTTAAIAISPTQIEFSILEGASSPVSKALSIRNASGGMLNWSLSGLPSWLQADVAQGQSSGNVNTVMLTADATALTHGAFYTTLSVTDLQASNNPGSFEVFLYVGSTLQVPSQHATIQAAIDAAARGDELVLSDGTYAGAGNKDLDFRGKAITVRSTSGDPKACIIDCQGNGRGFYFHTGESEASLVSGMTIRNGSVTSGSPGGAYGGGVLCLSSSPTLTNCAVTWNTASIGGGVYCYLASPAMTNCTINGNVSVAGGGGGGGIHCATSNPTLTNCKVNRNSAYIGGGIYCGFYSNPALINCTINSNTATSNTGGGGVYCIGSPTLTSCTIMGNSTPGLYGGGVYCSSSSPTVTNCIISGNTATSVGGVYSNIGTPVLTNCILWNDPPNEIFVLSGALFANYCVVQGGWPGIGNTDVNPLLTPDGHLRTGSPCIDAGDNSAVLPTFTADRDGEPRFVDDPAVADTGNGTPPIVDISCDEFIDTDGNGLPDWWEQENFGSPTGADPADDPDGDGPTNLQEYEEYGSNPTAPPFYVDDANGDDTFNGLAPVAQGGSDGPKKTIQAALDLAQSGDTVFVATGMYAGTGNFNLNFVGKNIVVRAAGLPTSTTINCGAAGRAFDLGPGLDGLVVIEGFTITGGSADFGGGIRNTQSRFLLKRCILIGNTASADGGGLYSSLANLVLDQITIGPNTAPLADAARLYRNNVFLQGPLYLTDGITRSFSTWFDGPGRIDLARLATLEVKGGAAGATPTVIRSDITGTGTISIDAGQQLLIDLGAAVDLSGEYGGGCADPAQAANWGRIEVSGQLVVRDSTIRNTNVIVLAGDLSDQTVIYNNQINLLQNPPGWGGEFFVEGTSTIECNVVYSEGDRYLDLDPDPLASPRPSINDNKFSVNILQGTAIPQGELLELRSVDYDNVLGNGMSGAYELAVSSAPMGGGYDDTWVLEQLEVQANAKVNLTNRQGFVFQAPQISIPEALYVKEVKLHPGAVLNTGHQRLYYQVLVDETGAPLARDPQDPSAPMANGSRFSDVPLLGFSLKIIALEDQTEFDVRVRKRLRDPADTQPLSPPYKEGAISRVVGLDPQNPTNGVMRIKTRAPGAQNASSVAAHGSFARAGEDEILVQFDYLFCGQITDELVVYLTDSPEVSENLVEVARIRPPASGPGSIGSNTYATFSGRFPRGSLNFLRGTYVELELRGPDACVLIDEWDPAVCVWCGCGDFSGQPDPNGGVTSDCNATAIDLLYLLSEIGNAGFDSSDGAVSNLCADELNSDGYIDMSDVLAWSSMLHDPGVLNLCDGWSGWAGGTTNPVAVPTGKVLVPGKPTSNNLRNDMLQQDMLYTIDPITMVVGPGIPAPAIGAPRSDENGDIRSGHGRLIVDPAGEIYQLHGTKGLIRLSDGQVVMGPRPPVSFGGNQVHVGLTNSGGYPLLDAAFDPLDPTVLYILPVQVDPPGTSGAGCPFRAAAKLRLTGGGGYTIEGILGQNPYNSSTVTSAFCVDYVYNPDATRMREVEVDSYGNVFILSAQEAGNNDYILIFPMGSGNPNCSANPKDPTCHSSIAEVDAPSALHISGDKLYVSTSIDGIDTTNTEIYRYGIQRTGPMATGVTLEATIDVAGLRQITGMATNPLDGRLWAVGYAATTCSLAECYSNPTCDAGCSFSNGQSIFFTDPILAVFANPDTTPELVKPLIHLNGNGLAVPLGLTFPSAVPQCGTGDFDGGGTGYSDIAPFVSALLDPTPEALCPADLNEDTEVNGLDIQPFVEMLVGS